MKTKIGRQVFYYLPVAVIMMCMPACKSNDSQNSKENPDFSKEFVEGLEIYQTVVKPVEHQLKLTGKVDYNPDKVVHYVSLVNGIVENTHFNLGDRVQKGQKLAVIRSVELSNMQAERKSLESEIQVLNRNLESVQSLYNDKLASQKDLMEIQSSLYKAQAELEKINANLSLYGSSGSGGNFYIKAPLSGFVVEKNIAPGMSIGDESTRLFTVADLDEVWIMANVYAGDLNLVKQGMPVDIRILAYTNEVFHGKIDLLSQVFDPEEHVLKARIVMRNPNFKFKPEMAADLTLKEQITENMIVVPTKALVFDDNKYFVILKKADNKLEIKKVELFSQLGENSYVSSGLSENEQVVIKSQLLIYNQLKK